MSMQRNQSDTTESPKASRLSYYASLDGLRGIALLAMLLYHSDKQWIPGGFLSVSTFFTLSGFLITSLLIYEFDRTRRIDLVEFWSRRFRRLAPGALSALVITALTARWIADPSQLAALRWDGLSALFYSSNLRFIFIGNDYAAIFASPSLVQHFWSLSIEEQFYLTYPLIAVAMFRLGGRLPLGVLLVVATTASTAWMAWLFAPDLPTSRLYYGTDTRAAEILVGGVLALCHADSAALTGRARTAANAVGLLGIVGTVLFWFTVSDQTPWLWQGGFTVYALITAAAIIGGLQKNGPADRLLGWGFFPWLGKLSYGVYLYHFVIFIALTDQTTGLEPLPLLALRLVVTFATSVASYYFLELPIRERRVFSKQGRLRPMIGLVGAIAVTSAALFVATMNPSGATDLRALVESERQTLSSDPDAPRILVVGDSVSLGVGKALQRWAVTTQHASVYNFALPGCGIARGGRLDDEFKHAGQSCDNWPVFWADAIETFGPDIVLVLTGGWDLRGRQLREWAEPRILGDPVFNQWLSSEYDAALDVLSGEGAQVLWLTTPCYRPPDGYAGDPEAAGLWNPERITQLNSILGALAVRRSNDFELIDLFKLVCPGNEFSNELGGISNFRPDGSHFSDEGADWLIQWLGPRLLAAGSAQSSNDPNMQLLGGAQAPVREPTDDSHQLRTTPDHAESDVLVLGDSLCKESQWVRLALGSRANNLCVSGVESGWLVDELQTWSPHADEAKYAIVLVGTNDVGRGGVENYEANLTRIVDELLRKNVEVWLIHSPYVQPTTPRGFATATKQTLRPGSTLAELNEEFDLERSIDRAICNAHDTVHCGPDLIQLLDGDQFFTDGVHFSPLGDRAVADAVTVLIPKAAPSRVRPVWQIIVVLSLGVAAAFGLAIRRQR